MSETNPRMKGAMLAEYIRWFASNHDSEHVRRFVRSDGLSIAAGLDADRPAFGIVPSEWYSAAVFHRLLDVAFERMTDAERAQCIDRSTDAVSAQLIRGLYAVLFALVATPDRYSRHIQRAWNQLHDTGVRDVVVASDHAMSTIREWPGHHTVLCTMVHSTTRAIFSRMLDRPVRLERLRCVSDGHPDCASRLTW
jgi:hypothetical protein